MSRYTRPIATAQRLLTKWGAAATLTRTTPGAYDPATGSTGTASVAAYSGIAFRWEYSLKDIDGTLIQKGDVRLIVAPKQSDGAAMPKPVQDIDTILFAGTTYRVIGDDPLSPVGEDVLYIVQARGV